MKIYSSAFQAINRSGRGRRIYAVVAIAQRHLRAYKRDVVIKRFTSLKLLLVVHHSRVVSSIRGVAEGRGARRVARDACA